jgi:hypothetical protein
MSGADPEAVLMSAQTGSARVLPRFGGRPAAAPLRTWLREWMATTPGRLILIAIGVVAGALVVGGVATVAERSRADAAQAVRARTEPLLVQAVTLNTALSDANATATTTFLKGGLEPPARRAQYLRDVRAASDALAALTRALGNSPDAQMPVATITQDLPVYSGLVEAARANNRQGFPVGAAYLRQASSLLTGTILPATDQLYATEAEDLSSGYGTGTAATGLIAVVVIVGLGLVGLVLAQVWVARASRRIVNVPMALASAVLLGLLVWAALGLVGQRSALARARGDSDAVEVLSATHVLLSRAQSDQSLTLVNRGSDQTDPVDFAAVTRALRPDGGLLGELAALSSQTAPAGVAPRLVGEFDAYRAQTARVAALQRSGAILAAINETGARVTPLAVRMSATLSSATAAAQRRFMTAASDATSSLSGLSIALPLLIALAGALSLLGLRARLVEYR